MNLWTAFVQRCGDILREGLEDSLLAPLLPAKRVFLPFLLGALVIGAMVWARRLRGRRSLAAFLFPREIWLHRSALLDYRLALVRPLIHAALFAPFALSVTKASLWIAKWLWQTVGILPRIEWNGTVVVVLFSVAAFVAEDFGRYVVHRLAHRVPALWELHKVHHSAEVLTPFSIYRTHPIESFLMRTGAALCLSVTAGVFIWLFPGRIHALEIAGIYAFNFVWNALGSNLRHSHIWLSYGPVLERVFISPAQHQLHHSSVPRQHHSNFGSALAVWDWLGGSLVVAKGRERLQFGLPPGARNHGDTVASVLVAPVLAALRKVRRRARERRPSTLPNAG